MSDFHLGQILYSQVQQANAQLLWNLQTTAIESLQFTSYGEGDFYDWHRDDNIDKFGKGYLEGLVRKISFSILLNDTAEYEGGDFQVWYGGTNGFITLPREKGDVLIFPTFYLHRVTPITKGERRALVYWTGGEPFR